MPSTASASSAAAEMTAARALSNLKGDLLIAQANEVQAKRYAGHGLAGGPSNGDNAKRIAVLKYAIAAVQAFKSAGKSPVKALAKMAEGEDVSLATKEVPESAPATFPESDDL